MNAHETLTLARQYLSYDHSSGLFAWVEKPNRRIVVGSIAGSCRSDGYTTVFLCGRHYYAHRLAWLMYHGDYPAGVIDHANGNRSDNRIANLRDTTPSLNVANSKKRVDSASLKGATWSMKDRVWVAQIAKDKKRYYLGSFNNEWEAHQAYRLAAIAIFGEFARFA